MKKVIKYVLITALIVLIGMQFIRSEKNNGGYESALFFEKETRASSEITSLLKTNCYDCHSNQTHYPWYAEIAPFSFWLNNHIIDGKKHFNVSDWESYSSKKKDHKLEELIEMVEIGEMPLDSYTWIHGDLSPENTKILLDWAALSRLQYQKEMQTSVK